jgi:ribosomal protein L6P/L9E
MSRIGKLPITVPKNVTVSIDDKIIQIKGLNAILTQEIPKELKINCDELSIYYFEPQPEGHTEVKKIRVDRHGELMDIWPNGFFSERDSELFL